MTTLAVLSLALGGAACGGDDDAGSGKTITVGSKNFDEQLILGEIYAQALESKGFKVEKKLNLGSEQIAYKALKAGDIDAYPEYVGTSLTSFFDVKVDDVPKDPDAAYEQAKKEYATQDITALPRTQFENTYRIVATKEVQQGLLKGATTVSEVADLPNADELSIAGFPECRQRTDCLLGLKGTYGWGPEFVSDEGKYDPIDKGRSDLGFVFSTDGELLDEDKYAIIEDDKGLFPPYQVSLGIRNQTLEDVGEEGRDVIAEVQEPLSEKVMRELNSRVSIDKEKPEDVARAYLKEFKIVE